jgi:PleD family two-component response regulator
MREEACRPEHDRSVGVRNRSPRRPEPGVLVEEREDSRSTMMGVSLITPWEELANIGDIIVVDDDPSMREIVTRYLEQNNVRVRVRPIEAN